MNMVDDDPIPALTLEQKDTFDKEGVLCIKQFLTEDEVASLLKRSHELLEQMDLSSHPKTQFKTADNDHIGDQYFFDSSDKIAYFFDVDVFGEDGKLLYPKELAVNKIGHGLHMKDKLFHDITLDKRVQGIARSLGYNDPRVLQSMCIFKHPCANNDERRANAVPPHTDGTFLFTEPQSAVGFWIALEDCSLENGCLLYSPGSHKQYPITKRFVKIDGGKKGCDFIPLGTSHQSRIEPTDLLEYRKVESQAGDLVLIHNSVLHKSEDNKSTKSRFAYAFHVIEGTAKYDNLNWLQVPPCAEGGTNFTKLYSG